MGNLDVFVSEVEHAAKNLDCGFFLFTVKAGSLFGESNVTTHELRGGMMLEVLKYAAKYVYKGLRESGMPDESAKTVVITMATSGIMEAANADSGK